MDVQQPSRHCTAGTALKVLLITSAYPARADDPRGTFIHALAQALVAEGLAVRVLAPGAPGAPLLEERDGVEIHRAPYWIDRWQTLAVGLGGIIPNLRRKPWLVSQLPPLVLGLMWHALRLGRGADLIHAHWVYPSGVVGLVSARWHRKPLVITGHGTDLNMAHRIPLLHALAGFISRRADACLGVSGAMVGQFERLGVPLDRLHDVPLGVVLAERTPSSTFPPDVAEFAGFRGLKVIYAGSLVPNKSVETLLEALEKAAANGRRMACLVLGSGPSENRLRALAGAVRAGPIVFAGEQPPARVPDYMRLADVLVLPSKAEGLGLVLVEAMASGLAVIASDIPGPREVIEEGVNGFLFPPGDSQALSGKLTKLIDEPGLARRFGAAGHASVTAQGRTYPASAAAHVRVYKRILGEHR